MAQQYAPRESSLGICAKSGRQMRLGDMVEDGYFKGLMVDPAWYDPPHPQERLTPLNDPEAVERPGSDLDFYEAGAVILNIPLYNIETNSAMPPMFLRFNLNAPTIIVS